MTEILRYLLLLAAIGLAGVPLAARALARLPGAGLGFARVLAWLLIAWLVWMLGSLGVPNGIGLALLACVIVAGAAVLVWRQDGSPFRGDPFRKRLWIASEAVFGVTFLVATWLGSHSPEIQGTEKPMDMMLMNATLASDTFPPHDPWLAGEDVNYYYLGQHMVALFIRLTGVEPSQGYNLGMAALFALVVSTAFTIGATLAQAARRQNLPIKRPLWAGALCVVLLALMGSLRGGKLALDQFGSLTQFDYFGQITRVIPNTINEFPFFSLTLGDVHAHVIAIPLTLLMLAFIAQVGVDGAPALRTGRGWFETFCAALTLGWLYAVNSWSWPVMVGLFALTVFVWLSSPAATSRRKVTALWGAGVIAGGIVLVLPFIVNFDPNAGGIGFTREAQREEFGDFLKHHLVIEGALLWLLVAPLVARFIHARYKWRILVWGLGAVAIVGPILAANNLAGAGAFGLGLAVTLLAALTRDLTTVERMLWVIAAGAFACLLGAEIGVVKDEFYGGEFERMNTVFKMGYQAWMLLAVFGAVALAGARRWLPKLPRVLWSAVAAGLIAVSLGYTIGATSARHQGLKGPVDLDGRLWLTQQGAPGDLAVIDWIRENADGDAVILEMVGDDYSPFGNGRMSTFTGRPTVLGWQGHELQWSHDVGTRREDVATIYSTTDQLTAIGLLARYDVDYAVVGPLERTTYGDPQAITQFGRKVFEKDGTAIYSFEDLERGTPVTG